MARRATADRKRDFTDDFIEGEFYQRFMTASPEVRRAKLLALTAADKLARVRFDASAKSLPLLDGEPEVTAQ